MPLGARVIPSRNPSSICQVKRELVVLSTLFPGELVAVEGLLLVCRFLEIRYRGRHTYEHPVRPSAYAGLQAFPSIATIVIISLAVFTSERGKI